MIEIFLVGAVMVGGGIGALIGRKTVDVTPPQTSFVCPYCDNVVTGFNELDLIHHVGCIGKSESDLAEYAKKHAAEDEYFVKYTRYTTNWTGQYNSNHIWHCLGIESYERYGFTLFRNGEEIYSGSGSTKAIAKNGADQEIELDKHKRRGKGRK